MCRLYLLYRSNNNIERRLIEHQSAANKNSYTSQRLPVKLVYYQQFSDFKLAIIWEKRIKKWSKEKKEALIEGNWERLKIAAACKNKTTTVR
jgi:putative endonuclease